MSVCVCVCLYIVMCVRGGMVGGKDQWRSVRMHSWRAPSSITAFLPLSSALCLCTRLRQERLRVWKHFLIIGSQFLHSLYVWAPLCVPHCTWEPSSPSLLPQVSPRQIYCHQRVNASLIQISVSTRSRLCALNQIFAFRFLPEQTNCI